MLGAIRRGGCRGAIGLIAAYALVLQTFLAYSIVAQAAAQGTSTYSGTFFVICATHGEPATPDGADAPVKPPTHCPICTLSASAAATLPDPIALPTLPTSLAERTTIVWIFACISFHRARAGLSRAPPHAA